MQSIEPIREPVGFQHRTRRNRACSPARAPAHSAGGRYRSQRSAWEALQKDLRARRILIQQRCCGGEQQDVPIAGLRAHRLLGLRQKTRMDDPESANAASRTRSHRGGRILPISARHLFRLIAEWENRLRRGCMRHGHREASTASEISESMTLRNRTYRGALGVSSKRNLRPRIWLWKVCPFTPRPSSSCRAGADATPPTSWQSDRLRPQSGRHQILAERSNRKILGDSSPKLTVVLMGEV